MGDKKESIFNKLFKTKKSFSGCCNMEIVELEEENKEKEETSKDQCCSKDE